jgi:regulator of sigma E protease
MPLGGYVKMLGQDDLDPTAVSDDPRAFNRRPIWARVCVVSAGVIMNAIFAVIFFQIAFLNGVEFPPAEVGYVVPGSPAAEAPAVDHPDVKGLKAGDNIVLVNGEKPSDFTSIRIASALAGPGESVQLVVERPTNDAGTQTQRLTFDVRPVANERFEGLKYVGIESPQSLKLVSGVKDGTELAAVFAKQGLEPGMNLIAVDDQPIIAYWQFEQAIDRASGQPVKLTFAVDDKRHDVTITPRTGLSTAEVPGPGEAQLVTHMLGLAPPVQIQSLIDDSAAAGVLEAGDVIASLADMPWPTSTQVIDLVSNSGGKPLPIRIMRDGKAMDLTVTPGGGVVGSPKLGVMLGVAYDSPYIARVLEESPFAALNLKPGTELRRIGDHEVRSFTELRLAVADLKPGPVDVAYTLPIFGEESQKQKVELTQQHIDAVANLGWGVDLPPFQMLRVMQQADGAMDAVRIGFEKTNLFMWQTYVTLARLFQGEVKVKNLRGPVGIAVEGSRIAEQGIPYLLFFLGLISINLAVINFLPLPIVDGGLFVLLMIEKARGRPVSPQIQSAITVAGLILLGTIFLVVTFHDIGRIFS